MIGMGLNPSLLFDAMIKYFSSTEEFFAMLAFYTVSIDLTLSPWAASCRGWFVKNARSSEGNSRDVPASKDPGEARRD